MFTLTDDHFRRKCGDDAVQYLRFQRHLLAFVGVITIVSIVVILPVNFQGFMLYTFDSLRVLL
jgi:hypothetical protein